MDHMLIIKLVGLCLSMVVIGVAIGMGTPPIVIALCLSILLSGFMSGGTSDKSN